eukprot:scaffold3110_cov341-Prasinococcus_capsulatus_cf.AAC.8
MGFAVRRPRSRTWKPTFRRGQRPRHTDPRWGRPPAPLPEEEELAQCPRPRRRAWAARAGMPPGLLNREELAERRQSRPPRNPEC